MIQKRNGKYLFRGVLYLVMVILTPNVKADDPSEAVPFVDFTTIVRLCGMDDLTLTIGSLTSDQKRLVAEHLNRFLKSERPRLYTHRAIWAEMSERYENLKASAAENTFDPCEFVTDEAVLKAQSAVQKAKEQFEGRCRKASEGIDKFLNATQCRLIRNAQENSDLPSPYRWLSLDKSCKERVLRILQIYGARMRLITKYPHLKGKLTDKDLEIQMDKVLSKTQLTELSVIKEKLKAIRPFQKEDKRQ